MIIKKDRIRLGIIGIGNMGSEHCRTILAGKCPEIELSAVADLRRERLAWAKENLPENTRIFRNGSELIGSAGESVSGAIESIFTGMIDVVSHVRLCATP